MNKKKLTFLLILITFLSVSSVTFAAQINLPNPLGNTDTFEELFDNVTDYILTFIGTLAVLVLIWSGILFVTSGMFPANYEKGKKALWYAVIGLAIVLAASGLVTVITAVIGAPTTP